MRRFAFSLRDLFALLLVACFILAAYRAGAQSGRQEIITHEQTGFDAAFDNRVSLWIGTEERWLEFRKHLIKHRKLIIQHEPNGLPQLEQFPPHVGSP
jgi:hypothetical protein